VLQAIKESLRPHITGKCGQGDRQTDRQADRQTDRQTLRQSDRRNRRAEASGKDVIEENPGSPTFVLHTSLLIDLQSFHAFFQTSLVVVPLDASFVRQWLQQRVLSYL
jgi:hypothetical protein